MNLQKIITELQAERERLDEAILALERLSVSDASPRGRPPRWLKHGAGRSADHEGSLPKSRAATNNPD